MASKGQERVKHLPLSIQHFPCHLANLSEKRKFVYNGEAELQKIFSGPSQIAGSATFIQTSAQSVRKLFKRKKNLEFSDLHCYR
jgi:hypothetical protein